MHAVEDRSYEGSDAICKYANMKIKQVNSKIKLPILPIFQNSTPHPQNNASCPLARKVEA